MSGNSMAYEVVEKGPSGRFEARRITKPGPTGLITTSIKPLGAQANTRTLTVSVPDSAEQTRQILHAHADRFEEKITSGELCPWRAFQKWLGLAGEWWVTIPFAHELADKVPSNAVRMRRDFAQLLTVIQTITLLRQNKRGRDSQGRVVATTEDYKYARWLLEDIFSATLFGGASRAIVETVEAVARVKEATGGESVSQQQLVEHLGLSKGTISYRVRQASREGWLVNLEARRGVPARLVPGMPLPDENPLPEASELTDDTSEHVHHPADDSNTQTPPSGQLRPELSKEGLNSDESEWRPSSFEPGLQTLPEAESEAAFESSKGSEGVETHTSGESDAPTDEDTLEPPPAADEGYDLLAGW